MHVGIHEAKTHLSRLIPAVLAGEEVIITKSGKALVKLVPVDEFLVERPLGCCREEMQSYGDLMDPLPPEELLPFQDPR